MLRPSLRALQALGNRVPGWRRPLLLTVLSLVFAVAAIGAAVVTLWRGGGAASGLAVALVLVSAMLSYRVRQIAGRYALAAAQRGTLLRLLGRLAPLEVRVVAVNDPDAVHYASRLRSVLDEARWPVAGVFKCKDGEERTGVTLAVRNVLAPPDEALALLNTLRRLGLPTAWGQKPDLAGDRSIEILIGRLQ